MYCTVHYIQMRSTANSTHHHHPRRLKKMLHEILLAQFDLGLGSY